MSSEAITFQRSQLATAERVVYLLSLNLGSESLEDGGGNVYRLATEPIAITRNDGTQIAFSSGLLDIPDIPSFTERNGFVDDGPSIPMDVMLPVSVAELWAKGNRFARARGELSAVTVDSGGNVQQLWEARLRQAVGYLSQPVFADPQQQAGLLSFTLQSLTYDDVGVVNDPRAVIDEDSWPQALPAVAGKVYPIVLGTPGVWRRPDGSRRRTSGSPAYPVEYSGPNVTTILIADGEVAAGTVRIFDQGGTGDTYQVELVTDGKGRPVSVARIVGGSISRTDLQYFTCWDNGGGLIDPFSGGAITTLGQAAAWLLTLTNRRVDYPKWSANLALLARVEISTYFNDPEAKPYDVLLRLLEPMPSVSVRQGFNGIYPLIRRLEISDHDVVHRITEGPDFQPDGPLQSQTELSDIRNVFSVRFAPRARTKDFKRYVTCTPDPAADDLSQFATEYSIFSASRYDTTATETVEAPFIYDDVSASVLAADYVRIRGFGTWTRAYRANHLYGWIEVGEAILLTSESLFIEDQFAEVIGKRPVIGGWVFLLAIDDDPIRNAEKRRV